MGDHDVSHLTDEELVLHRFGEMEDAAVRAHLAQCDACQTALVACAGTWPRCRCPKCRSGARTTERRSGPGSSRN